MAFPDVRSLADELFGVVINVRPVVLARFRELDDDDLEVPPAFVSAEIDEEETEVYFDLLVVLRREADTLLLFVLDDELLERDDDERPDDLLECDPLE